MAAKKNNYFKRVAKYQEEHPRADRKKAMEMVSKEISGAKRSPAKKVRSASPKKRSIIKTERVTTIGSTRKKTSSPVQRGISIARKIDDLELLLKVTSGTEAKNKVKRLINAEHDKLDAVTKNLKSA
jgi:hypothetical protein